MEHVVNIRQPHFWKNSSRAFIASVYIIVQEESREQDVLVASRKLIEAIPYTKCVIQICTNETFETLKDIRDFHNRPRLFDTEWDPYTAVIKQL